MEAEFKVGDLVTHDHVRSRGIVYEVTAIKESARWNGSVTWQYRIKPVFGCFGATYRKASRTEMGSALKRLDLVTLGREYSRLNEFIHAAVKRLGGELPDGSQ